MHWGRLHPLPLGEGRVRVLGGGNSEAATKLASRKEAGEGIGVRGTRSTSSVETFGVLEFTIQYCNGNQLWSAPHPQPLSPAYRGAGMEASASTIAASALQSERMGVRCDWEPSKRI